MYYILENILYCYFYITYKYIIFIFNGFNVIKESPIMHTIFICLFCFALVINNLIIKLIHLLKCECMTLFRSLFYSRSLSVFEGKPLNCPGHNENSFIFILWVSYLETPFSPPPSSY